jgi:hypothetical protein
MPAPADSEIGATKWETNDIRARLLHEQNRAVALNIEQ